MWTHGAGPISCAFSGGSYLLPGGVSRVLHWLGVLQGSRGWKKSLCKVVRTMPVSNEGRRKHDDGQNLSRILTFFSSFQNVIP